ncbi:uncharacterized protein LOC144695015 [Cetorhinus maximus]
MQTLILITCLVAAVFSSPIRKARDMSSSRENLVINPLLFTNNRLYRPSQIGPNYRLNSRFPNYFGYLPNPQNPNHNGYDVNQQYPNYRDPNYNYYPSQQYPNYRDPNYNYYPSQQYPSYPNVFNSYPMLFNAYPWTGRRANVLGVNGVQRNALSMSSEISAEDTNSMEGTLVRIPFINVPFEVPDYGVPGVPDNEGPFLPDNERPFAPGVDTNAVDVGFDQQNSQELSIEVSDTEEPASILPYSDTVQGMGSLGLNGEDDSMIGYSNEDIRQQNTMYEPAGLDVIYDQTLNNEELANLQMSDENLDEDVQTLEDETQNIGTNTVAMNSMAFSNDEDDNDDGIESNLNVAVFNNNGPGTQEQDNTQSSEDDLNQINVANSNPLDNSQSNEDGLNQINAANSNPLDNTQSNEDGLNQINIANSNPLDNSQSNEDGLNQINVANSNPLDNTQSNEDGLNQINVANSNPLDNSQSNEDGLNQINVANSNVDDRPVYDEDGDSNNSNVNNGADFNQGTNGDGASEDDRSETNNMQNELNSCKKIRCRHGRVCKLNENGYPTCICQDLTACPVTSPEFQQVCGTNNRTYGNSCQFFASKCLLEGTKMGHNIHLDYMGSCKYIAPCLDNELKEFPLHLRAWLKNILIQMYERDLHSPGLLIPKERTTVKEIYDDEQRLHPGHHSLDQLFNDFSQNYQMYIYPVHWQFSQLDRHPVDGYLSHSELAPLRTSLIPLEHCTSQFFRGCDLDGDRDISLREWGRCFSLKEEDINPNLVH